MQVISSLVIGAVPLRATVRQRSRQALRRIMPFGRRRGILLAILWVYGRWWLILAAMQRLRGLLLTRGFPVSRWSWPIVFPVILAPVLHRRRLLSSHPVEGQELLIAHGIIPVIHVAPAAAHPTLRTMFRPFATLHVAILRAVTPRGDTSRQR